MTIQELNFARKAPIWKQRIIECRSSGIGVKPWCRAHNLNYTTYYRWEKKILSALSLDKGQSTKQAYSAPAAVLPSPLSQHTDIVKVELAPDPEPAEAAMVSFTVNGFSLSVPTDISGLFLTKLLEATKHAG